MRSFGFDCHCVLIPYPRESGGLVSLEIKFLSNCHVNCPQDRNTICQPLFTYGPGNPMRAQATLDLE